MVKIPGALWLAVFGVLFGLVQSGSTQDVTPPAQIAVSPSKFEVLIGAKPSVESLRVFNLGGDAVTVAVSVATWDLDENNSVRHIEPTEQTLDQWLVINPLKFTVETGQSQAVRFSIRPRVAPEAGEHRAMIYLTEQPLENPDAPVTVRFQLGIAVYGYAGEVTHVGALHSVEVIPGSNPASAAFDISSLGNAHVRLRGQYAVWPADAFPGSEKTEAIPKLDLPDTVLPEPILEAGFLPTTPVLASKRRTIVLSTPKELPPGEYVLDLNAILGDAVIDQNITFVVEAPPPTPTASPETSADPEETAPPLEAPPPTPTASPETRTSADSEETPKNPSK
ncbi:MAG: hypothetical protein K8R59_07170 [Thermoanaerobaculales bacterium]|nr:hypothetical protein [Thermoanaerobaculales bacterium]